MKNADVKDCELRHGPDEAARRLVEQIDAAMAKRLGPWTAPMDLAAAVTQEPPPRRWFVEDRLELGRGVLLTGIGGSSKTRLLYSLAFAARTGRLPWNWQVRETGNVVLVLTEDTARDTHEAAFYAARGLGLSEDEARAAAAGIRAFPLAGVNVRLLTLDDRGALERGPLFDSLVEAIHDLGNVVFVGLDPALALTQGDEMDQAHQRQLGKMADDLAVRTGAAVALVAHATKASATSDELGSHNSRGGGAITDAVRAEFAMRTMTAKEARDAGIHDLEERKRHVQLVATKGNHLPPAAFVPTWLRRGPHGALEEANVSLAAPSTSGPTDRQIAMRAVLREIGGRDFVKRKRWQDACEERGLIHGNANALAQAMTNAVRALRASGDIEAEQDALGPASGRQGFYRAVEAGTGT